MTDDVEVDVQAKNDNGEKGDELNELAVESGLAAGAKSTGVGSTDSNDSGLAGDHSSPEHHERTGQAAAARPNRRRRPNAALKIPPYPGFEWASQPVIEDGFYSSDKCSEAVMDCEYGMDSNFGSHVVYVHVNIGETLNVRVGMEVQHITGPATVRMVSRYSSPPAPLPLDVPPGHIVQQILDEYGTLKHLVLSLQTSPPNSAAGPFHFVNMTNGYHMTSDGHYVEPGLSPFYDGTDFYAPSPVQSNVAMTNQEIREISNRTSKEPPFQRPYRRYTNSFSDKQNRTIPPRIGGRRRRNGINREPFSQTNDRLHPTDARLPAKPVHLENDSKDGQKEKGGATPLNSQPPQQKGSTPKGSVYKQPVRERLPDVATVLGSAIAASNDEDEITKMKDMLSRIPPPRVCDIEARTALVQWQPFDCSEASANGGSFPQIDSSEFTYEIVLYESDNEDRPMYSCRSQANLFPRTWLKNLKPVTDYFVKLRASLEERGLVGEPSVSVCFKTNTAEPEKPDTPTLNQKSKTWLLITWQETIDNGSQVTNYHLELTDNRENCDNFKEVYTGLAKQFKIEDLKPSTSYQIRLAASNVCGKSEYSELLIASTASGGAPTAPAPPFLVQAASNSLTIEWVKRDCDDEFELLMEDGEGGYRSVVTTRDVKHSLSDLLHSHKYRFYLRSSNEDGQSPLSDPADFSTLPPKPSAPSKPMVNGVVSDKAEISWEISDDIREVKLLNFLLEMMVESSTSAWTPLYKGPENEFAISHLEPGSTCRIRVCCETDGGKSQWSEELKIAVPALPPSACCPPTLMEEPTSTVLHLQWNPPQFSGGLEIAEYELMMTDPLAPQSSNTEIVQCPLTQEASRELETDYVVHRGQNKDCTVSSGLRPGRAYVFQVRARNAVGVGPWSQALKCETAPLPPACPERLRAVEVKTRSISLIWDQTDMGNGGPTVEYWLYRACRKFPSTIDSADQLQDAPTTAPMASELASSNIFENCPFSSTFDAYQMEVVHVGPVLGFQAQLLYPATEYAFCIQAGNIGGKSAISGPVVCLTLADSPDAPVIVKIDSLSMTQITVFWDPPSDNGSVITCYHLEVATCAEAATQLTVLLPLPGDAREYVVENLLSATTYRFRVKAINEIGPGDWSEAVEADTRSPPPPAPKMELASATHNSLKLKWRLDGLVSGEQMTYTLEMSNTNGEFAILADDLSTRTYKVTRLSESTKYQFRVRACSTSGGIGEWSDLSVFSTLRAPPPAVKCAPRVSNVTETSCDITWEPAKLTAASVTEGEQLLYSVQFRVISPSSATAITEGVFETVHKGVGTSYHLVGLTQGSLYKIRVCSVRISESGAETESAPSPVATFSTIAPSSLGSSEEQTRSKGGYLNTIRDSFGFLCGGEQQFSDRQWAALILVAFSIVALFVAFLLQRFIPESSPGERVASRDGFDGVNVEAS